MTPSPNLTLSLAVVLLASLGANAFLGWQWAEASAECDARIEKLRNSDAGKIGKAAAKRDKASNAITKDSDQRAEKETRKIDVATQEAKEVIRYVYVDAPADSSRDVGCTAVRPVDDRVQHVIDAAVTRANR